MAPQRLAKDNRSPAKDTAPNPRNRKPSASIDGRLFPERAVAVMTRPAGNSTLSVRRSPPGL